MQGCPLPDQPLCLAPLFAVRACIHSASKGGREGGQARRHAGTQAVSWTGRQEGRQAGGRQTHARTHTERRPPPSTSRKYSRAVSVCSVKCAAATEGGGTPGVGGGGGGGGGGGFDGVKGWAPPWDPSQNRPLPDPILRWRTDDWSAECVNLSVAVRPGLSHHTAVRAVRCGVQRSAAQRGHSNIHRPAMAMARSIRIRLLYF